MSTHLRSQDQLGACGARWPHGDPDLWALVEWPEFARRARYERVCQLCLVAAVEQARLELANAQTRAGLAAELLEECRVIARRAAGGKSA